MKSIKNEYQLKVVLLSKMDDVIDRVVDKMLKALKDQIISDTYRNEYFPNVFYHDGTGHPTGEFLESWDTRDIRKTMKSVTGEIFFNPSKLSIDKSSWLHGSLVRGGTDARKNLADILNLAYMGYTDGWTSGLMAGNGRHFSKLRKPYWDNFMRKMFDEGQIDKWMRQEMKAIGLDVLIL